MNKNGFCLNFGATAILPVYTYALRTYKSTTLIITHRMHRAGVVIYLTFEIVNAISRRWMAFFDISFYVFQTSHCLAVHMERNMVCCYWKWRCCAVRIYVFKCDIDGVVVVAANAREGGVGKQMVPMADCCVCRWTVYRTVTCFVEAIAETPAGECLQVVLHSYTIVCSTLGCWVYMPLMERHFQIENTPTLNTKYVHNMCGYLIYSRAYSNGTLLNVTHPCRIL